MPTVADIAKEMGIDISALDSKFTSALDQHYSNASTQLTTANQAKAEAEENLRKAQKEHDEINQHIQQFGESEATMTALRANNAAMEASLKALKERGLEVTIPDPVPAGSGAKQSDTFDPNKFRGQVGSMMEQSIDVNNRYFTLFNRPLPDSIGTLAREASERRMSVMQYASQKYDFAGEEKRQADARQAEHDKKVADDAVAKYKDSLPPNHRGNPDLDPGVASKHSQILKPRTPESIREFAGMTPAQKIAASVKRSREIISANQ